MSVSNPTIGVNCSYCGRLLTVESRHAGETVRCSCGAEVAVPMDGEFDCKPPPFVPTIGLLPLPPPSPNPAPPVTLNPSKFIGSQGWFANFDAHKTDLTPILRIVGVGAVAVLLVVLVVAFIVSERHSSERNGADQQQASSYEDGYALGEEDGKEFVMRMFLGGMMSTQEEGRDTRRRLEGEFEKVRTSRFRGRSNKFRRGYDAGYQAHVSPPPGGWVDTDR